MDEIFTGSAICEVTSGGEIVLPRAFHETARYRSPEGRLMVGVHCDSRCLVVYDPILASQRLYDSERQRGAFAASGLDPHDARQRRLFGFADQAMLAPDGMIVLPPLLRDCCRIGDAALLVGAGDKFEIWDLAFVREHGPADMVLLALLHRDLMSDTRHYHQTSLTGRASATEALSCAARLLPRQISAVQPRHDPID